MYNLNSVTLIGFLCAFNIALHLFSPCVQFGINIVKDWVHIYSVLYIDSPVI